MRRVRMYCSIVIFFVLIVCAYDSFWASKPEKTIISLVEALNKADYDLLISCYEPDVQKASKGILGLGSSLLGFELSDILGVVPLLVSTTGQSRVTYDISNVRVVKYEGGYLPEYMNGDSGWKSILGCFLGDSAEVEFELKSSDSKNSTKYRVNVQKYNYQWLIPINQELVITE